MLLIEADDVQVENLVVRNSGRRNTFEDAGVRAKGRRIRIRHVLVEDTLFGITLGPCPECAIEHCHVRGPTEHAALQGDAIKLWESNHAAVATAWSSRDGGLLRRRARRNLRETAATARIYAPTTRSRNSRTTWRVRDVQLGGSGKCWPEPRARPASVSASRTVTRRGQRQWFVANTTGTYLDITPDVLRSMRLVAHSPLASDMSFSGNSFATTAR